LTIAGSSFKLGGNKQIDAAFEQVPTMLPIGGRHHLRIMDSEFITAKKSLPTVNLSANDPSVAWKSTLIENVPLSGRLARRRHNVAY
jgi:hypothetical protein